VPENMVSLTTGTWPRIGLSGDASGMYYIDPFMDALVVCPKSGPCTPSVLLPSVASTATSTATTGGKVYLLDPNASGYSKGTIVVCPNAGTCTPNTFINNQPYPTLLAADTSGVYWHDSDAQDIKTCPLAGCTTTRTLVTGQVAAVLRTNTAFVYWATATQILRVAK
jgi:hypothetical protein